MYININELIYFLIPKPHCDSDGFTPNRNFYSEVNKLKYTKPIFIKKYNYIINEISKIENKINEYILKYYEKHDFLNKNISIIKNNIINHSLYNDLSYKIYIKCLENLIEYIIRI